jgi:YbgC/YbaW family acyl-CoA thioester hydrolase
MTPQPHVCAERIRWADVDLVGIARFSAFTRFVEHAEQEWLRAAGMPYHEIFNAPAVWLPRRHLSIEYHAPARIDDALAMVTFVPRIGETSMAFQVEIVGLADGTPRATATVTVVCVNATTFQKQPLPEEIRQAAQRFLLDRATALEAAVPMRHALAQQAIFQ